MPTKRRSESQVKEVPQTGLATAKQAAEYLGLTAYTIYVYVKNKKLPKADLPTRVRIPWEAIHALAKTNAS